MWICFAEERILFSIIWFYWKLICSILTLGRSSDTKERRKRDAIWIFDWKLLSRRHRRSGRHKKFLDIYFLSAHTHLAIVCWSKWSSLLCAANYRRRATSGRRLCCVNWIDCLTSTRLNYHCVEREKERFISAYKHFANCQDCRVSILENCVSWLTRTHERWYREEAPHSINRKVVEGNSIWYAEPSRRVKCSNGINIRYEISIWQICETCYLINFNSPLASFFFEFSSCSMLYAVEHDSMSYVEVNRVVDCSAFMSMLAALLCELEWASKHRNSLEKIELFKSNRFHTTALIRHKDRSVERNLNKLNTENLNSFVPLA